VSMCMSAVKKRLVFLNLLLTAALDQIVVGVSRKAMTAF